MENTDLFFLVLGMHRSGTSCLTGCLKRCGVYLGNVSIKGKYNKKGNQEIKIINRINENILRLNGGNWLNPPNQAIIVHPHLEEQLTTLIHSISLNQRVAIKDPRILLMLNFWKTLIGEKIQLVGSFRHPLSVAHSLLHRNNIKLQEGIKLWYKYNSILANEHRKNSFPLIHYDLKDKKKYIESIKKLANLNDLQPQYIRLQFFVSRKLEHHNFNTTFLDKDTNALYQYLLSNSLNNLVD